MQGEQQCRRDRDPRKRSDVRRPHGDHSPPALCERRPDITMEMADAFLNKMYRTNADFVFTVTRDFVRSCQTPILVLPDDVPAHPYAVAMEVVSLAPKSEVSIYPWKDPKDLIPQAVSHVRNFLKAHQPVEAAR